MLFKRESKQASQKDIDALRDVIERIKIKNNGDSIDEMLSTMKIHNIKLNPYYSGDKNER